MLYSQNENFLAFSGLYLKKATQGLRGICSSAFGAEAHAPVHPLLLRLISRFKQEKFVMYVPLNEVFSKKTLKGAVV